MSTYFGTLRGGSELMYNELEKRINKKYLRNFSLFNYVEKANFNKKTIYWTPHTTDQQSVNFFNDLGYLKRINHFVFVSYWQAEQYKKAFDIPEEKISVIKNACAGVDPKLERNNNKIKVCYTSTPWRGLNVLLDAWEILKPKNAELHIFSGTKVYSKEFYKAHDKTYKHLYDKCKRLPNVIYRDNIPNNELRKELPSFDMLAYPSTWEETSCISVIEAISAGLRVVCSSLGALPETTEGWAYMYPSIKEPKLHAKKFASILEQEIEAVREGIYDDQSKLQSEVYAPAWHWDERVYDWENFFESIS